MENGLPVEHFIDILPIKKANAETITGALIACLKNKQIPLTRLIGMGFDGAAAFSGKKSGVQDRLKMLSPHALYVHCHCHLLQLACVQAANETKGIKHVYTTLMTMWKYFHYSLKRTESLKEIQQVLNLPELKVLQLSDIRWLAHERCAKAVKSSYPAIVLTLDHIYEETHEPEALGISKALCKACTIEAVYILDNVLPPVATLVKPFRPRILISLLFRI